MQVLQISLSLLSLSVFVGWWGLIRVILYKSRFTTIIPHPEPLQHLWAVIVNFSLCIGLAAHRRYRRVAAERHTRHHREKKRLPQVGPWRLCCSGTHRVCLREIAPCFTGLWPDDLLMSNNNWLLKWFNFFQFLTKWTFIKLSNYWWKNLCFNLALFQIGSSTDFLFPIATTH